jgi:NAD(P)-dependent dehydrogenase (short-subunit alcohol dehydrogenase family)
MDVNGKVSVVTGGASGIGRALCLALAESGAAAVVVADVDGGGAAQTAAAVEAAGHPALAVPTDMSREEEVRALVSLAEEGFGPVGLFCSNAGIIVDGGVEVADEAWSRIWAINVQAHVYVARALLPGMLARGEGYLVITASAAGLLTERGSAPYSVTKHAAVGLAEWLSITYGDQGLRVSCLCPQAVRTNLIATSQREVSEMPEERTGLGTPQASLDGVLTAEDVAACVIEAIGDERFLILPHPEVAMYEQRRAGDRDRWLRGMRRLQARLGTPS